jgi:hypothetical protein
MGPAVTAAASLRAWSAVAASPGVLLTSTGEPRDVCASAAALHLKVLLAWLFFTFYIIFSTAELLLTTAA